MLSESDLRELLDFTSSSPVLSVYLNTDPSEGNADAYRLRLRTMLKDILLPQDVSAVEHYFTHQYNWSGRGVAVFSCHADGFFRAYPLAVPVRNMVYVGDRPAVKPLANLFDTYGGYGVALVDKQGARAFYFHLGELREQEGVLGEAVKHTKRGGASSYPGRMGGVAGRTRYAEELVERNMKDSVEFITRFFEENKVRRVLICGTDENINMFRNMLPKAWQSLVVGSFPMSMTATHTEVLNKALEVGREAELRREARLVEDLITLSAKGGNAVTGLEATLKAISQGRVQILIFLDGFRKRGFFCKEHGILTLSRDDPDVACGDELEVVYDVVELAVNQVLRTGGNIEVISASPDLEKAGNIGAMLRY